MDSAIQITYVVNWNAGVIVIVIVAIFTLVSTSIALIIEQKQKSGIEEIEFWVVLNLMFFGWRSNTGTQST